MELAQQPTTPMFVIRISDNHLSFATRDVAGNVEYLPQEYKAGISVAANLREVFRNNPQLLANVGMKATVIVDSPTMLIPIDEYQSENVANLYHYTYPGTEKKSIEASVLPSFKDVCIFGIDKDLKTVLNDNFAEVRIKTVMQDVWEFLLQRCIGSNNRKLFAYFHDDKVELCSFNRNRFSFCNTFEAKDINDAIYFILGTWKNIGCNVLTDDLFVCGKLLQRDAFTNEMKNYLRRVYYINPAADFNRAPVTKIMNMPFDMMLAMM